MSLHNNWKPFEIQNQLFLNQYYAKNIYLAWINWELNQQEERLESQKRKVKK